MSRYIDQLRAEIIRAHPEWKQQGFETSRQYQQRMLTLCKRLSKGAMRSVDPKVDAEAVAERAAIQAEAEA